MKDQTVSKFGECLRSARKASHIPGMNKEISLMQFGKLLFAECGRKYSATAIYYWESGKTEIHKNDRSLLTAILKVLHKYGGIKTIADAENLLAAGNYRALDDVEKYEIFPNETPKANSHIPLSIPNRLGNIFFHTPEEFQKIMNKVNDGPSPAWPRMMAAIMGKIGDWIGASSPLRMLLWLALWILAYTLLRPSIQWPFLTHETAKDALYSYLLVSFILPLLIGVFIHTDQDNAWNERKEAPRIMIRLYTYQGAYVGFHVGYFLVFILFLVIYYLQLGPGIWIQFLLLGLPIFLGIVGAHVIPDNLWKAYKRLSLSDGWIFFVFIIVSPFWTWFFLEYYPWLTSPTCGVVLVLSAFILAAWINKPKINR